MTYDFRTEDGRIISRFFKSLGSAIAHFESPDNEDTFDRVPDPENPGQYAERVYGYSGVMFYGDGFYKPSPSGKSSTVGPDPTKVVPSLGKPTNTNSFLGRK